MPAEHLREPASAAASAVFSLLEGLMVGATSYAAYELPAPQRDALGAPVAPPYIGVQLHPNPDVTFVGRRAMAVVEATVVAIGPEEELPALEGIAREVDGRLERHAGTTAEGAFVLSCRRTTPLRYPSREGDLTYMHVGGLYRLEIA